MGIRSLSYRLLGYSSLLFTSASRRRAADSIAIMTMHGLHTPQMATMGRPPSSSMPVANVEKNLGALAPSFSVISLDEAVEMLDGRQEWRGHCVALTFDDSLKCMAEVVAPALIGLGLPATFFVSTEAIDKSETYWWLRLDYAVGRTDRLPVDLELPSGGDLRLDDRCKWQQLRKMKNELRGMEGAARLRAVESWESTLGVRLEDPQAEYPFAEVMTWDDVRALEAAGMTIGSHSVTHPNLAGLASDELRFELADSKGRIDAECRGACRHLCYPSGLFSAKVPDMARDCGYISAVTTHGPGWNRQGQDLFQLNRYSMPRHPYQLPYLLSGAGTLVDRLRHQRKS